LKTEKPGKGDVLKAKEGTEQTISSLMMGESLVEDGVVSG
jgi:hypothetical protein